MTIYSLDVLLFLFGTRLLFHVQFELLLPNLHIKEALEQTCSSHRILLLFSRSVLSDSATPWMSGFPVHHQLPELVQSHVHQVGDAIQPSHPLSAPSPPALNLSQHQVFSNESALHIRWPKYWSFSFNISHSSEHLGLTSFRMDWLDLLAVQGTLKSSPTPQIKIINSLVISFLYSPTLTSIHDYWKKHSLD